MSVTGEAADILEGEAERLLWFPVVTLSYIFTLSGNQMDFFLAAGSVAGVRLIQRLMELLEIDSEDNNRDIVSAVWNWGMNALSGRTLILYCIVVLLYGVAVVRSLNRLLAYFSHTDIVLVGLSVFILGSAGVVFVHLVE